MVHFHLDFNVACNCSSYMVEDETVMNAFWGVEKVDIEQVIGNESASNERVWEVVNYHGVII